MRALCRAEWGRGIRAFGPRRAAGTTDRSFGGAGLNAFGERRGQAKRRWEGRGMARKRARRTLGPARAISPALFSSSPRELARVLIATFASVVENRGRADFGARSSDPRGAAKGNPVSILIGTLIGASSHFGYAFFVSLSLSPMNSRAESDLPARVTGGCFPPRRFSRSRPSRVAHSRLAHERHGTHGG